MDPGVYFTPELFEFLTELRAHNERTWFERNRPRFESAVRDPFLGLIAALGPPLRKSAGSTAQPQP
jgi:uncharacterized protein (DUF2461 family)